MLVPGVMLQWGPAMAPIEIFPDEGSSLSSSLPDVEMSNRMTVTVEKTITYFKKITTASMLQ